MLNTSFYTLEQLNLAVPKAVARIVRQKAASENRTVDKKDFFLVYKDKNGNPNLRAAETALRELETIQGLDKFDKASIKLELSKVLGSTQERKNYLSQFTQQAGALSTTIYFEPETVVLEDEYTSEYSEKSEKPEESLISDTQETVRSVKSGSISPQELLVAEFLEQAKNSKFVRYTELLTHPGFRTQLLNLAETPEGFQMMHTAIFAAQTDDYSELSEKMMRIPDYSKGTVDNDFRNLPNYRTLGIDREAGIATEDEIRYAKGQLKNDNTPVGVEDFFSTGALLANNDIIPQLMAFIPSVELKRLETILLARSKKSDQDHNRKVMSGPFTVVNPKIGKDEKCKMHVDHPLLGLEPYTGLIARLLYPEMEHNMDQRAAVESAKRGQLQNLSIAFGYNSLSCATCGELTLKGIKSEQDSIYALEVEAEENEDLCMDRDEDNALYRLPAILRIPINGEGGFAYKNINITNSTKNGILTIDPISKKMTAITEGTKLLVSMNSFYSYWMGGVLTWCNLHGMNGNYQKDGRRTIAQFTQMRSLINTAHVDAGAINDARCVLHPDVNY